MLIYDIIWFVGSSTKKKKKFYSNMKALTDLFIDMETTRSNCLCVLYIYCILQCILYITVLLQYQINIFALYMLWSKARKYIVLWQVLAHRHWKPKGPQSSTMLIFQYWEHRHAIKPCQNAIVCDFHEGTHHTTLSLGCYIHCKSVKMWISGFDAYLGHFKTLLFFFYLTCFWQTVNK